MLKNPNYKTPSLEDIERAVESCGYEYYLPMNLLEDLIVLCSFQMLGKTITSAYSKHMMESEDPFVVSLLGFYNSLRFDDYKGTNPLEKSLFMLSKLSEEIDFRKIESKEPDFQREVKNFKEELDEVDEIFFEKSCGELDNVDMASVISLSSLFNSKFGFKFSQKLTKTRSRMKSYSDFMRSSKVNLIRPDFLNKLVKKSLIVDKDMPDKSNEEILIYLEDGTNSMTKNKGYLIAQAVKRLLLKDVRKVHYYRFYGQNIFFEELNTFEEKLSSFASEQKYYDLKNDYSFLIDFINKKYPSGNVFMVTDGNDYVNTVDTGLTYHFLGVENNLNMRNFVKSTGGKYLIL
jgi:hypothetical protein